MTLSDLLDAILAWQEPRNGADCVVYVNAHTASLMGWHGGMAPRASPSGRPGMVIAVNTLIAREWILDHELADGACRIERYDGADKPETEQVNK
jgi:hypothetical protein